MLINGVKVEQKPWLI